MEQKVHFKKSPFETDGIGKLIAKFSIPCVISLLVSSLYNIVDQIFIGRSVGYLGNGATNVVFPITVIVLSVSLLIGDGCASYFSLKLGEKDTISATKGIGNGIMMLIISAIIFFLISFFGMEKLIMLFGCTETIKPFAMDYGIIIAFGLPFALIGTAFNAMIRADGSPKYAMIIMLLGAAINTVLDPVFIFVFGWGMQGAAIATIIGQIASCVLAVLYIPKFKHIKLTKSSLKLDLHTCKTVLSLGISSFITQLAIVIVVFVANNQLAIFGAKSIYGSDIAITAQGIVMKVNQILISIVVGISAGAQPIIGYNYGAKNHARVKKTLILVMVLVTAVSVLGFILFQFFPQIVINLFGSEEGLYNEFARKCFRIFLLAVILNGFTIAAGIFFQAIKKTIESATVSLARQIVFLVPLMLILPNFMGVEGVLWAGAVADTLGFILALILVIKQGKTLSKMDLQSSEC